VRTAENIKCRIGAALPELEDEPDDLAITGPSVLTSLPQTITLNYSEIAYALEASLLKLDEALMKVLTDMPAELYSDVVQNGIYLAGGGALIKGLSKRLSDKTGIPFHIADDPLRAIARGTNIALKNINRFSFLLR
jgi:rod shape-determining protein MreB